MYNLISPRFSFIQFSESSVVQGCRTRPVINCLPVYDQNDVWFQFVIEADTEEEAEELCGLGNTIVQVGIASDCDSELVANFTQAGYQADRFRISSRKVLYNWQKGLPGFQAVVDVDKCFVIRVEVGGQSFCSPCLVRIGDDCYTSVIEYGNDENGYGFNYCADANVEGTGGGGGETSCVPLEVSFVNKATLTIPYTAQMLANYGNVPSVQGWIYDENGDLVNASFSITFDGVPPTYIYADFGGTATGFLKIM